MQFTFSPGKAEIIQKSMLQMEQLRHLFYVDSFLTFLLCCSALIGYFRQKKEKLKQFSYFEFFFLAVIAGLIYEPRTVWLWLPSTVLMLNSLITFSSLIALDDGIRLFYNFFLTLKMQVLNFLFFRFRKKDRLKIFIATRCFIICLNILLAIYLLISMITKLTVVYVSSPIFICIATHCIIGMLKIDGKKETARSNSRKISRKYRIFETSTFQFKFSKFLSIVRYNSYITYNCYRGIIEKELLYSRDNTIYPIRKAHLNTDSNIYPLQITTKVQVSIYLSV